MVVGDVVQNKGGGKMVISFQVKSKGIHFVLHKGDFIIFSAGQIGTLQSYN